MTGCPNTIGSLSGSTVATSNGSLTSFFLSSFFRIFVLKLYYLFLTILILKLIFFFPLIMFAIRFTSDHEFEKPNDECGLNLMNSCATAMFENFPDIVFAYGVSDEYRWWNKLLHYLFIYFLFSMIKCN